MEQYQIRRAEKEDIPGILTYINNNWLKNHWLVRNKKAFEWQYTSDDIDFVIGLNNEGDIKGILGYISYDDFDDRDIALSMWMANPEDGFLGIKLLQFVMYNIPHRTMFSPGINVNTTESIYKMFKIYTGRMTQWYRLGNNRKNSIAIINHRNIPSPIINNDTCIHEYLSIEEIDHELDYDNLMTKESVPYKSKRYFERRYFMHPEYQYSVYGVKDILLNKLVMLFVTRIQEYLDSSVMILADVIGDISRLKEATLFIDKIMNAKKCEYIHTYITGIDDAIFADAGWLKTEDGNNIIPNYFNPFVQKNVDVFYCTTDENIAMFKGDGDQDRPK